MIVVCDTSPLNYLVLIGEIAVLPRLFAEVILTPGVLAELRHPRTPAVVAAWSCDLPPWIRLGAPHGAFDALGLGLGEAEVIAVAGQIKADAVLIDERKAVGIARECGLLVTGTLGVLALAAEAKFVDLNASIRRLLQTNFRASPKLIDELLRRP
jgi:predicted nucleic acid-binding protein